VEELSIWAQLRTLPNLLSLLRLALVPVFLVLIITGHSISAFLVLALASFTDWLDGYLARKLNQVTRIGALLDPAADRLYIFATLIGLTVTGAIPAWLPVVVISRDVLLAFTIPVLASRNYGPLPVHFFGKAGTFALLYAFPLLLLADWWIAAKFVILPVAWAFALWGVALYWYAGFLYVKQVLQLVKSTPKVTLN
jgi:cardiolipin synthase (CMP-forming)